MISQKFTEWCPNVPQHVFNVIISFNLEYKKLNTFYLQKIYFDSIVSFDKLAKTCWTNNMKWLEIIQQK